MTCLFFCRLHQNCIFVYLFFAAPGSSRCLTYIWLTAVCLVSWWWGAWLMDGVQDISDRQLLIALKSREQQSERNNELIAFTAWLPAQQTPDTGVGGTSWIPTGTRCGAHFVVLQCRQNWDKFSSGNDNSDNRRKIARTAKLGDKRSSCFCHRRCQTHAI